MPHSEIVKFFSVTPLLALLPCAFAEQPAAAGSTRVARWKDDKKAALMLMFDDSAPTHVRNVMPELKKRGLIATFYVNPGSGNWAALKSAWEKDIPADGMEYGNHTMTHKGVLNMANAEEEIGNCNEVIAKLFPGKNPRLISYGQPGVPKGAWNINDEQLKQILEKEHLIHRPPVDGRFAFIHLHSVAEMMKVVDDNLNKGGADCVLFHGVGGDWLTFPLAGFKEFLDKVVEKREQLWITGHISAHKYETERDGAEVKVLENGAEKIQIELKCKADLQLYDAPLTLVTQVPAAWKKCEVMQGASKKIVESDGISIKYDALPNGTPVNIRNAP